MLNWHKFSIIFFFHICICAYFLLLFFCPYCIYRIKPFVSKFKLNFAWWKLLPRSLTRCTLLLVNPCHRVSSMRPNSRTTSLLLIKFECGSIQNYLDENFHFLMRNNLSTTSHIFYHMFDLPFFLKSHNCKQSSNTDQTRRTLCFLVWRSACSCHRKDV